MQSLGRLAEPCKPGQLVLSTNGLYSRRSLLSWLFGTQKASPHRNRIIDGGLFPRPVHKNLFNAHAAEPGLATIVPQAHDLLRRSQGALRTSEHQASTLNRQREVRSGPTSERGPFAAWLWRTLTLSLAFTCNCAYHYISLQSRATSWKIHL